jgi:hypothetical protein
LYHDLRKTFLEEGLRAHDVAIGDVAAEPEPCPDRERKPVEEFFLEVPAAHPGEKLPGDRLFGQENVDSDHSMLVPSISRREEGEKR